jgi:hypothetical protein
MTLNDVSNFLFDEDMSLQKKITKSHMAYESFKMELLDFAQTMKANKLVSKTVGHLISTG